MALDRRVLARLCRARELLSDAEASPSIRRIAAEIGISQFHFIRQFEAVFGATPHQFRTRERLERAKQLLARGESVTDVCFEVGFSSVGSFSGLFTRHVGTNPSTYRQRRAFVQVRELHLGCFGLMGLLPAAAFRNSREAR